MDKLRRRSYQATRIKENIWEIFQEFVRAFLFLGEEKALLLDTCAFDDDLPSLVRELTMLPVMVVQTHCDDDHIAASCRFDEVYMHPSEFALLRETAANPLRPRSLREGTIIDLGNRRLEVLLMPGHTPGSIALLDEQNRLLFSGDSIKSDIVYMFGPGRDIDAYIDSLSNVYARGGYDKIYACHGDMPVAPDIIPDLIEGATLLSEGKLRGEDDGSGHPCLLYRHKRASFYYQNPCVK